MISNLATERTPGANAGPASGSPAEMNRHMPDAGSHNIAREGVARIASTRPGEAEVIAAARPVVVKEILKLCGNDLPDPRAHERYLNSLTFAALCCRRDQLMRERLPIQKEMAL